MATTTQPVKRVVIEMGQSIASPLGDMKSWEAEYPYLAIRSPNTHSGFIPQFTQGQHSELFTMPGTFPGGPTVDNFGNTVNGQYQKVNLAGVAIEGVSILTGFNPSGTFQTFDVFATSFPGTSEIAGLIEDPTPSRFMTNHLAQPAQHKTAVTSLIGDTVTKVGHGFAALDLVCFSVSGALPDGIDSRRVYRIKSAGFDPDFFDIELWPEAEENAAGAVVSASGGSGTLTCHKCQLGDITRRRTQTTHTAAHGAPGSLGAGKVHISVHPPMLPAPVEGEYFSYPIVLGDTSVSAHSTAGPMAFRTRFGGLHDAGSTASIQNARIRQPASDTNDTVKPPLRVTCERMPMRPGRVLQFQAGTNFAGTDGSNDEFQTFDAVLAAVDMGLRVDDPVEFTGAPAAAATGAIQIDVDATTGTFSRPTGEFLTDRFAVGMTVTTTGFADAGNNTTKVIATIGAGFYTVTDNTGLVTSTGVGSEQADAPAAITSGTRYWVVGVDQAPPYAIRVSATKGGASIICAAGIFAVTAKLPDGLAYATNYYVTRLATDEIPAVGAQLEMAFNGSDQMTYIIPHGMVEHERVRLRASILLPTATVPPQLQLDRYYYVKLVDDNTIQLTKTPGGAAISFTFTAGDACIVERVEDLASFHIAATPGGEELSCDSDGQDSFAIKMRRTEKFAGSLSGLRIRCTSGANAGQSVMAKHVSYDSALDLSLVHHDDAWDSTPTDGDQFVVEPPPLADGTAVPYEQWFKRLPWSPLQGRGQGMGDPLGGSMAVGVPASANEYGDTGVFAPGNAAVGEAVRFYTDGEWLPNRLVIGQTYYSTADTPGNIYFSETPDGTNFVGPVLSITSVSGSTLTCNGHDLSEYEPVTINGDDVPAPLVSGTRYYAIVTDENDFQVSATVGGTAITLTDVGSGTMTMEFPGSSTTVYTEALNHEGRENPYPPGWSYPNQHSLNKRYQPFDGPNVAHENKVSAGLTIALLMNHHFGEEITLLNCAFGGTSLGHKEIIAGQVVNGQATGTAQVGGFGAIDLRQGLSWSPEDRNGCFKRFTDMLDGLVLADKESGTQSRVELVYLNQGEEDQRFENLANQYGLNLRKFKAAVRKAIKDRGLYPGPEHEIRFVQPIPRRDYGTYPEIVEAAIKAEHDSDPYARWTESSSTLPSLNDVNKYDPDEIHLAGSSLHTLGGWVFDAWRGMERGGHVALDVCKLALANIGDSATITSVDPPDDSQQARLCSQYYDLALKQLLNRHNWDFAQRRVSPTAITTDRTEWLYSYALPGDFRGVHAVLTKDATDDVTVNGTKTTRPYSIELDSTHTKRLYCNEEDVILRYYAHVADPSQWSESFVIALAWQLAAMIAPPLLKGEAGMAAAKNAMQLVEFYAPQAAQFDARTTREKRTENDLPEFYR